MQSLSQFARRRAAARRNRPAGLVGRLAAAGLAACVLAQPVFAHQLDNAGVEPLAVETADGERHELCVYVARTSEQKRIGLMFVQTLAPDRGMLFTYDPPRNVAMWMKNTLISLDMLFVRGDGIVDSIAAHTQPMSERHLLSRGDVAAVLELNAGTVDRLGIRPGDRLLHPWFDGHD